MAVRFAKSYVERLFAERDMLGLYHACLRTATTCPHASRRPGRCGEVRTYAHERRHYMAA